MMRSDNRAAARTFTGAALTLVFFVAAFLTHTSARADCTFAGTPAAPQLCPSTSPTPSPSPTATSTSTPTPTPTPTQSGSFTFPTSFPGPVLPTAFPTNLFGGGQHPFPTTFPSYTPNPLPTFPQPQYGNYFGTNASAPLKSSGAPNGPLRAVLFLLAAGAGTYTLRRARVRRWMIGL